MDIHHVISQCHRNFATKKENIIEKRGRERGKGRQSGREREREREVGREKERERDVGR
jgi:hypothetical protein